jgi:exoribonuclease R
MKVKVTIGTTYVGCPSESFIIECDSIKDFETNDAYSTEILNAICNFETPHYFIDYDYDCNEEDEDDYEDEDDD